MTVTFFGIHGAIPSADSGNVSLAVQGSTWSLLIDTSGNPVQSLLKAGINPCELDAVALTHMHTDHVYAFPSLIHTLWMMKRSKPLICMMSRPVRESLFKLLDCFGLLEKQGLFPIEFCEPGEKPLISKSVHSELLAVQHSTVTHGVHISYEGKRLLYTADTAPCNTLNSVEPGADLLIHEASCTADGETFMMPAGHSSGRQAAQLAEHLLVKHLMLCHLPPKMADAQHILREAELHFHSGKVIIPKVYRPYIL